MNRMYATTEASGSSTAYEEWGFVDGRTRAVTFMSEVDLEETAVLEVRAREAFKPGGSAWKIPLEAREVAVLTPEQRIALDQGITDLAHCYHETLIGRSGSRKLEQRVSHLVDTYGGYPLEAEPPAFISKKWFEGEAISRLTPSKLARDLFEKKRTLAFAHKERPVPLLLAVISEGEFRPFWAKFFQDSLDAVTGDPTLNEGCRLLWAHLTDALTSPYSDKALEPGEWQNMGSGSNNTVRLARYNGIPLAVKEEAFYANAYPFDPPPPHKKVCGGQIDDPRIAQRNEAALLLAKAISYDGLVETEIGTHEGKLIILMQRVEGRIFAVLPLNEKTSLFEHPEFRRQITYMQLADSLAGQVDRNERNFMITSQDGNPRLWAIDNDACCFPRINAKHNNLNAIEWYQRRGLCLPRLPLVVDVEMAKGIARADQKMIRYQLERKLTKVEIDAVVDRLEQLKAHVVQLNEDGWVIDPSRWGDEDVKDRLLKLSEPYTPLIKHSCHVIYTKEMMSTSYYEQIYTSWLPSDSKFWAYYGYGNDEGPSTHPAKTPLPNRCYQT